MSVLEFLSGKKTYITILVGAIDQVGIYQGWWDEGKFREIVEAVLMLTFLRMGVTKSGSGL